MGLLLSWCSLIESSSNCRIELINKYHRLYTLMVIYVDCIYNLLALLKHPKLRDRYLTATVVVSRL